MHAIANRRSGCAPSMRQMAAWVGLVPKQSSSGGKDRLGKITKRGDTYLRSLLTQGARATLNAALGKAPDKRSHLEHWIVALRQRVGYHKSLVAISPISTPASAGRCSHARKVTTRTAGSATHLQPPEPSSKQLAH